MWYLSRRLGNYSWLTNHPLLLQGEGKKKRIMIKTVPDTTLQCEECVYYGKFQFIEKECRSDIRNPVKYIEVEE